MGIDRANKKNIDDLTDLPDVSQGVMMFFQRLKVDLIQAEQVDGYTDESNKKCIVTEGVRQPFTPQQLDIKPEGERAWKWSKLHCLPNLCLKVDDIVKIRRVHYRVKSVSDWAEYGYIEYDLLEDYRAE